MTVAFPAPIGNKPYKGNDSYEIEDGSIFFGRTAEAEQIIAKILASRLTVLHAQSGAGKSSMLNARIIPGLEMRGWTVVLARPHFDPSEAFRMSALQQIFPPPSAECKAIQRSLRALVPSDDAALQEVLDKFDLLQPRDDRRRQLIEPLPPAHSGPEWARSPTRPLFFRLLRASLVVTQYGEHIEAMWNPFSAIPAEHILEGKAKIGALLQLLSASHLESSHLALTSGIEAHSRELAPFFKNLLAIYGSRRTQFGLVLIMDQFEELFTRFTGNPGATSRDGQPLPAWQTRIEFFSQLQLLYQLTKESPIHLVISMRDEYIAQLDPLRRFVYDLDSASFHLTFLEKEGGRDGNT